MGCTPTRATVHCYGAGGDAWSEFIAAMHSGQVAEIDEAMYYYWLEVLPPAWMGRMATLPDGRQVRANFGFAEGRERIVAFWEDGERFFCCQTMEVNRG